ncbi:hypothetical protein R6Q59_000210 [Mikania micrantha]
MATSLIAGIFKELFQNIASRDLINLARSAGIESELKKVKEKLLLIQAVLADADQRHITETSVELWLTKLRHLAYEIGDVLDDLSFEAMRRRRLNEEFSDSASPICISKITKFISDQFHALKYSYKMVSKLDEIKNKLHDIVEEKNLLGLHDNVERPNRTSRRLEETSLVEESKIIGREGDKEALLGTYRNSYQIATCKGVKPRW